MTESVAMVSASTRGMVVGVVVGVFAIGWLAGWGCKTLAGRWSETRVSEAENKLQVHRRDFESTDEFRSLVEQIKNRQGQSFGKHSIESVTTKNLAEKAAELKREAAA